LSQEDVTRETGYALQLVNGNAKLKQCPPNSILAAIVYAASTGLTLNPAVQHSCLIPRWTRDGTVCEFQPMYRGLMFLATQEGAATKFNVQAVHANDVFQATPDNDAQPVTHSFTGFNRGAIVGYYSVATMLDGTKTAEFMSVDDIRKVRDCSDGYKAFAAGKIKSHPWDANESEMAKKTIIKRHVKRLPSGKADSALYKVIDLDNKDYTVENVVNAPKIEAAKLPVLNDKHPKWNDCINSVANEATRKQAEAHFSISDNVWADLVKKAAALKVKQDLQQTPA